MTEFSQKFWRNFAKIILRYRILLLVLLIIGTVFWTTQFKNIHFTFKEANLLPEHHIENVIYNQFVDHFEEDGNTLVIALKDSTLFTPQKLKVWNELNKGIRNFEEVSFILSLENLKTLTKNKKQNKFETSSLISNLSYSVEEIKALKKKLLTQLPFYENLIYSSDRKSIRSIVFIREDVVNNKIRKEFILNTFLPLIEQFEKETGLNVHVSGMPYIRTLNTENIKGEINLFILLSLAVTSLIFFLFFKSVRATLIAVLVVFTGVIWVIGILGLFHYKITLLTALIPPLIIVIGIPNCIYIINKYQQEIVTHKNKIKALQHVITKVGYATLLTNLTTACGFITFVITDSTILKEFGLTTFLGILSLFIISIIVIPVLYSFFPLPKKKHLKHLDNKRVIAFIQKIEYSIQNKRTTIYLIFSLVFLISLYGASRIIVSGNMLDDMSKSQTFFKDFDFFDTEFNGTLPIEIFIDTQKSKKATSLATLKRIDKLEKLIGEIPELSIPLSITNIMKYGKQAFYNGNPKYYALPSSQENRFILPYFNTKSMNSNFTKSYVDSTGRYTRVTTFMKNIDTQKIIEIENKLKEGIKTIFPTERYTVKLTGKPLIFLKSTNYLIKNLIISLLLATLLIALFIAYLFRSFKIVIISIIPNILPLLFTAGIMGIFGIPLKPSTILVFSIAFGISVDDTIHFLTKFRQEFIQTKGNIQKSVFLSLRQTGVSMFYTSIVLFFGFLVFTFSTFKGTVSLGILVSITLLFAMITNLTLLPSLLIRLHNKKQ